MTEEIPAYTVEPENIEEHEYQDFVDRFNQLQRDVHHTAYTKAWWDEPREDGTLIALMHEELSEALRALRKGRPMDKHLEHWEALTVELADTIVRIMDFAEFHGLNVASALVDKSLFNKTRPKKHGNNLF